METWMVTGCSSGIGLGIAAAALAAGKQVVVTARNPARVQALCSAYPDTAFAVALDVTSAESIQTAVQAAQARFGGVDVLVNNAGHGYRAAIEEGEDNGVEEVFQTNFFGPMQLICHVLPHMRAQRRGAIINVSSIAAVRSSAGSGYYAASKAALELASNALYKEVSPLGIRVMIVEPGAFRTQFYDDSLKGTGIKIDDYSETAGKKRKENVISRHDQLGDPMRAGQVIVETMERSEPPRRLLLGSDAVQIVADELRSRLEEVNAWSAISSRTDYPEGGIRAERNA